MGKKIVTAVTMVLLIFLLIAQFITIRRTNPPLKGDLSAPPQIKTLLGELAMIAIPTKPGGLGTHTSLPCHD